MLPVKIYKNQLVLLLGALGILLSFLGCEYIRRQPADDAARQLEEALRKDKEIERRYKQ